MQDPHDFPSGVITAAITPMHVNLQADMNLLVSHCDHLIQQGGDGIVLLGTTGEANSFSVAERMQILEGVLAGGIQKELLMAGTGCCALTDTVNLTAHALQFGVRNVLMLPPFYYKPLTDDALFAYYGNVIERIGDDRLRIYLYHIPQNTGIPLSRTLIEKLLSRYPGIVRGIKDSSGDWMHTQQLIKEFPAFRVYSGSEEFLLDTLQAGGVGCISATANLTVSLAAEVVHMFQSGENASEVQAKLSALRNVFKGYPFVGALKGFIASLSGNPTWNYLRPPNTNLDQNSIQSLIEKYKQVSSAA